jgi:hypothetical protein
VINVNSIASHLASNPETSELAPLLQQLARRADVNRDGQVTSAEFNDFLSKLTSSLDDEVKNPAAAASPDDARTPAAAVTELRASASAATRSHAAALRALVHAISKDR